MRSSTRSASWPPAWFVLVGGGNSAAQAAMFFAQYARTVTLLVRGAKLGDSMSQYKDDGPGIPADVRARMFEPFLTTKEAGKGTGLGLEIVQRVVARHHGTVQLTSTPGATRFEVRLPAEPRDP